jgi:hypothetical protein
MANITPRRQQAIESIRMELGIAEIYGDETVLVYARRVATESIKYHGFFHTGLHCRHDSPVAYAIL